MAETVLPNSPETNQETFDPIHLSLDIDIRDLPYVIEGTIPHEPSRFDLEVSLPIREWQELRPTVETQAATDQWFRSRYHSLKSGLHLGDGKVGSVWVAREAAPDETPAILISRIQTDNLYLPESSPYYHAAGVGSFLLDSVCAIADQKGWRVYLEPLERDGRLMGNDLNEWYERRGFHFKWDVDEAHEDLYDNMPSMMRLPGPPDLSQPVGRFLRA